jgi:protein-L-isoaspartate(D-aspartate) O-methyltransferase
LDEKSMTDAEQNERMIRSQIVSRGVTEPRVLNAMRAVPRSIFVPADQQHAAFDDTPLPIGAGQTISQPFIVAYMTALLQLRGNERVLELGSGCGYQTAILARLASTVCSAELEPSLTAIARANLERLAVTNVELRVGDGVQIFKDRAPFDAILSAAAPLTVPDALVDQLADGGRMIIPAGPQEMQSLWLIERKGKEVRRTELDAVRFVPLRTSEAKGKR